MSRPGRCRTQVPGSGGFTLVEAMFATVLLCTGLLAAATLVSVSVHAWRRAGEMTAAVVAVAEIADSFGVYGASGGGSREYAWGRVVWDDPVPVGALAQISVRANARDSARTELLGVTATVAVR